MSSTKTVKKKKGAGGRPTKYSPEVLKKTREYIDQANDETEQLLKQANMEKGYEMYENRLKVRIPTLEGLALHLHVHKDTIQEWKDVHKEFSVLIGDLLAKQASMLIHNGLSGTYNPTIAKVLLSKHGYREGTELSGLNGKDLLPETVTPEEKARLLKLLKND